MSYLSPLRLLSHCFEPMLQPFGTSRALFLGFGSFLNLSCALAGFSGDLTNTYPKRNVYWPGDFEHHVAGGCFSKARGVMLSQAENHTPGGNQSWAIQPGYQHLELVVKGYTPQRLTFMAKTESPLTLQVKIIERYAKPADLEKPYYEIIHPIDLIPGSDWREYTLEFSSDRPFPGPELLEILLTVYHGGEFPAFIDDVAIQEVGPTEGSPVVSPETDPDFPALSLSALPIRLFRENREVSLPVNLGAVVNRKILLSADVAFETNHEPEFSWSGVLLELSVQTKGTDQVKLKPDPMPHWLPFGLSAPTGEYRTVSAVYWIPPEAGSGSLAITLQPRALANTAWVGNVTLRVIE